METGRSGLEHDDMPPGHAAITGDFQFDIIWTNEELREYFHAELKRTPGAGYTVYALLLGIGLLTAVLALWSGATRPDKAGVIATLGTLAAVGGWCLAAWIRRRQASRSIVAEGRRNYRVVVDSTGIRFVDQDTDSLVRWTGFTGIEVMPNLIRLTTVRGRNVGIPRRYLAAGDAARSFKAFATQHIDTAKQST